ncbi:hypothetical protein ANN_12263 [Periplaneta americana]|uniref:Ionotropic glutamate receptor C-terminal domain-containing protein n=1 Tax=Periplaneta americana TaxID=6978 RepID=A0ABQ8TI21_PERAM|nr:hypothetical protein ANN_12263 [Periplaneta americana]
MGKTEKILSGTETRIRIFSSLKRQHVELKTRVRVSVPEIIFSPFYPFFTVNIPFHVSLARGGKDHVLLQDVYHVARGQPLIVTAPRYWQPSTNLPQPPSRTNYGGISIRTVTVLAEGTWENFMDFQLRHLNTESKVQYVLMGHIAEMLNFRMDVCLTNTWGYPINGSKCFNGAVGMLQCGGCEIGATGLLFKTERMAVIDYAGETIAFRGAFMFLKPSLSEVSVIYELPFDTSVWITYTVTVAVLTIVLMFTRRVYQHVNPSPGSSPVGWGDTIMDSLAIVCQQDALHSPKNISSRVVFFCMLLLTVFLITSYSATIVSLLQTSSDSINTLSDLMRSPLKLSMIDIFVNETTDPEVTKVFKEKLYTQPFEEAFTTEEVGIEKIRKGLFAFHGLAGSYKIISDTYEDHEKCRFKEIEMFSSLHISFTAKKGSPYIPHIKERTCWLREVGLVDRENRRWFYQKPKCETAEQNFVSVGIQDFYPALVVMAYGAVFSIGMLIMEVIYYRKKEFPSCVPHKIMY